MNANIGTDDKSNFSMNTKFKIQINITADISINILTPFSLCEE